MYILKNVTIIKLSSYRISSRVLPVRVVLVVAERSLEIWGRVLAPRLQSSARTCLGDILELHKSLMARTMSFYEYLKKSNISSVWRKVYLTSTILNASNIQLLAITTQKWQLNRLTKPTHTNPLKLHGNFVNCNIPSRSLWIRLSTFKSMSTIFPLPWGYKWHHRQYYR